MLGDPFAAVADIIVGYHKTGVIVKWFKLLFGSVFSFWISFNTVAGGCLIAKLGWPVSIGYGMVSGAAMALTSYLRSDSKLTSGVVIAVPQQTTLDATNSQGQGPEVITSAGKI
jgi:hypothetical protein